MITKFDSSYYGTVDMEDLGYTGKPINERRYTKEQLAGALHKVVKYAQCMDARGYHTRAVGTCGSPLMDQEANRGIFEEGVDILFKAFEGKPFCHQGKYYTIPPEVPYRGYTLKEITLIPAPERLPVECWQPIQSGSERAFDFMAKHGISGVIGGGSAEGGAVERHMLGFQAAYARRGIKLELGERLALGYQFHIASSR